jgi:hypothetical protein
MAPDEFRRSHLWKATLNKPKTKTLTKKKKEGESFQLF